MIITGRRPCPFLPVDSATNCSIQSDNPGTFDFESEILNICLVCENNKEATSIAGEPTWEKVLEAISASSKSKEISIPSNAAGTKPNADKALKRPPTKGSAFTTLYPDFLEDLSSGVSGSVTIIK